MKRILNNPPPCDLDALQKNYSKLDHQFLPPNILPVKESDIAPNMGLPELQESAAKFSLIPPQQQTLCIKQINPHSVQPLDTSNEFETLHIIAHVLTVKPYTHRLLIVDQSSIPKQ